MHARRREEASTVVQPILKQLVDETEEIAWFAAEEHGKAVYLNKALGDQAVQPYGTLGGRVELYNIAAGKAILSELSLDYVREIISESELNQDTENTITDVDELLAELDTIRERGYAYNQSEVIPGFRAVASSVVTDGRLHGAIAISGPESRMQGERFAETIPNLVTGATNELEMRLRSQV
jgi:DNA-binding IclR family transcriptional regulator